MEYINGIKQFFTCDDPESPVKYNELAYGYPALPGGDATPTSATQNQDAPTSPTGKGAVASQAPSASVVNNTGNQNDISQPTSDTFRQAVINEDSKTSGVTFY
jgi:hypothetical protein